MGHKVHPIGIRLGISKDWNSKWYANKAEFAGYLAADLKVREMLRKERAQAGKVMEGWNPERWSQLDAIRAALVLSRPDLAQEGGALAVEEAFKIEPGKPLKSRFRIVVDDGPADARNFDAVQRQFGTES